eukprot:scaffold346_cov347-Pavlova_lutheri.AAC.24
MRATPALQATTPLDSVPAPKGTGVGPSALEDLGFVEVLKNSKHDGARRSAGRKSALRSFKVCPHRPY